MLGCSLAFGIGGLVIAGALAGLTLPVTLTIWFPVTNFKVVSGNVFCYRFR